MRNIVLMILFLLPVAVVAQDMPRKFKKTIKKHRKAYKKDFLENERSPLTKKGIKYLDFYEPSSEYAIQGTFERTTNATPFEMPTSSGVMKEYVKYGIFIFEVQGKSHQLAIYQSLKLRNLPMYRDYLFIPFKDLTNGNETYGGGRYIDLKQSAIKGDKLTIDFNKAYNPYCAFKSEGYSCPIPPRENHLSTAIKAGEKDYKPKSK